MTAGLLRLIAATALLLPAGANGAASAQNRRWREISKRPLVKFDGNCASPSAYPLKKLGGLVRKAVRQLNYSGTINYADRAFAFDLNGDGRPEYFIPLVCGATGNCDWGVFALNPARSLGVVNGQYIYLHARSGGWPDIVRYGHMSAAEGTLGTYVFKSGKYADARDVYHVGTIEYSQFFDVRLHKMPTFLERAKPACERVGW